ncbi:hypothetical protein LIER_39374 [Lithospermum erythrorhizon]|uniref:Uncharacterized protein n=1 Tax=Lithospermum erythrorhizon TaxID=34254 RepID=A0AAV3QDQ7_LITER
MSDGKQNSLSRNKLSNLENQLQIQTSTSSKSIDGGGLQVAPPRVPPEGEDKLESAFGSPPQGVKTVVVEPSSKKAMPGVIVDVTIDQSVRNSRPDLSSMGKKKIKSIDQWETKLEVAILIGSESPFFLVGLLYIILVMMR